MSVIWNEFCNFSQALRCISECKQFYEKYFGERHPDYVMSLEILSLSLLKVGRYSEAFNLMKKCLDLMKEVLGENHNDYLISLGTLGIFLG